MEDCSSQLFLAGKFFNNECIVVKKMKRFTFISVKKLRPFVQHSNKYGEVGAFNHAFHSPVFRTVFNIYNKELKFITDDSPQIVEIITNYLEILRERYGEK